MTTVKLVGKKVKRPENGGRRLVITDIHGCAKTFNRLLETVAIKDDDQLFLLGDFINRGKRSKQVIDKVLQLMEYGHAVYPLMGNHEETVLHILAENPSELQSLLKSRKSLNLLNKKGLVKKRFVRFFRSLPYYYQLDEFFLVHAGFNMKIEKPLTDKHAMCWVRNFNLKKPYKGRTVLYGHTPKKISKIEKAIRNNASSICLDNGCSHTYLGKEYGALLCYDLDTKELFRQENID